MQLPIDVVPGSNPPRFKWRQVVKTINGSQTVDHEGLLPPAIENAVALLLDITKQVLKENAALQGLNEGLAERVNNQSELLTRKAEKPQAPPERKKGK